METPVPSQSRREWLEKYAVYYDDPIVGEIIPERNLELLKSTAYTIGLSIFPRSQAITISDYGKGLWVKVDYEEEESTSYFYNSKGRLIEINEFYKQSSPDLAEESTYRFYYDNQGRLNSLKSRNINFGENEFLNSEFIYHDDGSNLVTVIDTYLDEEGTILDRRERVIDSQTRRCIREGA